MNYSDVTYNWWNDLSYLEGLLLRIEDGIMCDELRKQAERVRLRVSQLKELK